jgi:hypothetical protein
MNAIQTLTLTRAGSAAEAAREVRELGSTVLRQVWPLEPLARIRGAIAEYSARRAARVAAGTTKAPAEKMYATHGVGTFAALLVEGVIEPDFLSGLFAGSFYRDLCAAYFEDDAFYAAFSRVGFRNHDPRLSDKSYIPYHQDSYTQDKRAPRVLNCWIPLDPGAGRTSPGLEVVRDPCMPDFPRKDFGLKSENAAYDFITIDRARIVEFYGERFLAPEFEVGDGLVFSENVIHRTYVTPEMTAPRINFELRVFTPKCLAPGVTIADLGAAATRIG